MESAPRRGGLTRFVASSFGGEVFGIHKAAGGDEQLEVTRKQLLEKNFPVNTRASKRIRRRDRNGNRLGTGSKGKFEIWAAAKHRERRGHLKNSSSAGRRVDGRGAYHLTMQALSRAWRAGATYAGQGDDHFGTGLDRATSYADRVGNALWGSSSVHYLLDPKVLETETFRISGCNSVALGKASMFSANGLRPTRQAFLQVVCVHDCGSILDSWKLTRTLLCGWFHPGFCWSSHQVSLKQMIMDVAQLGHWDVFLFQQMYVCVYVCCVYFCWRPRLVRYRALRLLCRIGRIASRLVVWGLLAPQGAEWREPLYYGERR